MTCPRSVTLLLSYSVTISPQVLLAATEDPVKHLSILQVSKWSLKAQAEWGLCPGQYAQVSHQQYRLRLGYLVGS